MHAYRGRTQKGIDETVHTPPTQHTEPSLQHTMHRASAPEAPERLAVSPTTEFRPPCSTLPPAIATHSAQQSQ
eukprot:5163321-Amphidinium_carterae.1